MGFFLRIDGYGSGRGFGDGYNGYGGGPGGEFAVVVVIYFSLMKKHFQIYIHMYKIYLNYLSFKKCTWLLAYVRFLYGKLYGYFLDSPSFL